MKRSLSRLSVLFTAALTSLSFSCPVHAEMVNGRTYLGGLLGFSSMNNNLGTGAAFGVQAGHFLNDEIGVGAFLKASNQDNSFSSFAVAGEILYRLTRLIDGLHLGIELGSAKLSNGNSILNSTSSTFAYGAKLAYDYPISSNYPVTLGADVSLLMFKPGGSTITAIQPMATAKLWF